jgi:GntR family transcriptional regulator/MocR family aminotransferase
MQSTAPASQANLGWDVLLELDTGQGPLHSRLRQSLLAAIRAGRLAPGSALPPSRKLASDLNCSRWVVTEAYAQLIAEGYLEGRAGSATRVSWSDQPAAAAAVAPASAGRMPRFDLVPGLPDLRAFPRQQWATTIKLEAQRAAVTDLAYQAPGGHPRLRHALADYLRRVRGAAVTADDVTVCTGITDGVMQVCRSLAAAGIRAIAIEDPVWRRLCRAAAAAGLTVISLPVDQHGFRVADLAGHPEVRAVVVAPAHQFPTGVVLAPERRTALLQWAQRVDGVILEDDYDAEFRFDGRPVAALQGMDSSRVLLLGSASKILSPAMGMGWVVSPPRWTEALRAGRALTAAPPTLDQLAFATFIETGSLDRHLRSCRSRYRHRRDALIQAVRERLPRCRLSGIAAGLHVLMSLPDGVDAAAVTGEAAALGVRVANLDRYRALPEPSEPGLVLGYGNLADQVVSEAVRVLAGAIERASLAALN